MHINVKNKRSVVFSELFLHMEEQNPFKSHDFRSRSRAGSALATMFHSDKMYH